MRARHSFAVSALIHAALILGALALSYLLAEPEKEEEIVLELSLAASSPQQPPSTSPATAPVSAKTPVSSRQSASPVQHQALPDEPEGEPVIQTLQPPQTQPTEPVQVSEPAQPTPPQHSPEPARPIATPTPQTVPLNTEQQYLDDHLSAIRDILIRYRKYPNRALLLKQEGQAKISFRLNGNGEVDDIRILETTGYEILDDDARALIQKTARYFPKPPKPIRITVPLNYKIRS